MSTPAYLSEGHCACGALVTVEIARDGGLATADHTGYSGFTDDGDHVCCDCFCPTCGDRHTEAAQFDTCAFRGRLCIDITPPMSRTDAFEVLGKLGRAMRHERTVLR